MNYDDIIEAWIKAFTFVYTEGRAFKLPISAKTGAEAIRLKRQFDKHYRVIEINVTWDYNSMYLEFRPKPKWETE